MTDTIKTSSRRRTPWTENDEASPLGLFIDRRTERDYELRHPLLSEAGETELLNSYELHSCRHCGSEKIKKDGFSSNGTRRYRCNSCGRRFSVVTNTIFDNHKISISEWIGFLLDLFGYGSFNLTSKVNRNSVNTTKYWTQKTFLLLDGIQDDVVLKDKVWLDETYYKVRKADVSFKTDGLEYRGLSYNQMCIGIACDSVHSVFFYEGLGKPSRKRTLETFSSHICPGSILLHDQEKSHSILVDNLNLQSTVYNSKDLKKLPDSKNPLDKVNNLCALLKLFLRGHSGFIRSDIQGYLNMFHVIMNPPDDKYRKIEKLLNLALEKSILLRYRG